MEQTCCFILSIFYSWDLACGHFREKINVLSRFNLRIVDDDDITLRLFVILPLKIQVA